MKTIQSPCMNCYGLGQVTMYEIVSDTECQAKQVTCGSCGGKGYTEYAVFSVEEAKAILKHCGLSEE